MANFIKKSGKFAKNIKIISDSILRKNGIDAHQKLQGIIESNYGKNNSGFRIGNGSTADVYRYEKATGDLHSPSGHRQKVVDMRRRIKSWLNSNPNATDYEKKSANDILDDLNKAFDAKY